MIRIMVDSPEEILWMHEVISTGTINLSEKEIESMERRKIPLSQDVTYVKSDAYLKNHKKSLKELEDNGK